MHKYFSDSFFGGSGSSSPSQSEGPEVTAPHSVLRALFSGVQGQKMLKGEPGMKNTLFDEGLRIAQQYGLGDFAEELKTLKDNDQEESSESVSSLIPSSVTGNFSKTNQVSLNGTNLDLNSKNGGTDMTLCGNGEGNHAKLMTVNMEAEKIADEETANGS